MANAAGTSVPLANVAVGTNAIFQAGTSVSNSGTGGAVAALTFIMRATDTTLAQVVYWTAAALDGAGASYTGPGPLSDVVVTKVIGN